MFYGTVATFVEAVNPSMEAVTPQVEDSLCCFQDGFLYRFEIATIAVFAVMCKWSPHVHEDTVEILSSVAGVEIKAGAPYHTS